MLGGFPTRVWRKEDIFLSFLSNDTDFFLRCCQENASCFIHFLWIFTDWRSLLVPLQTDCFNYIKILLRLNSTHLYVCGTYAFSPVCAYIVSNDLSIVLMIFLPSLNKSFFFFLPQRGIRVLILFCSQSLNSRECVLDLLISKRNQILLRLFSQMSQQGVGELCAFQREESVYPGDKSIYSNGLKRSHWFHSWAWRLLSLEQDVPYPTLTSESFKTAGFLRLKVT